MLQTTKKLLCISLALMLPTGVANSEKEPLPHSELQQFTRVINHIKSHYVKDTSDKELFKNAIRGMLSGLDPHSAYLDEEDYADLRVSTTGKFGGLGIEVTMENGFVKVVSPIDDTPASKAGILAGDLIIKLDDTPVKGLDLKEAVALMRGDKGEPIILSIVREGESKPLKIKVVRDIIKVTSTKHRLLEKDYGYIRVTHFQTKTAANITNALEKLVSENKGALAGLVLDLRNNPGGVLNGAIEVSDLFLDEDKLKNDKLIVYTEGRLPSSKVVEKSQSKDKLKGVSLVVLVNGGSASASEIVAGALQDHNRAVIMGTQTFGKGSVQTVLPLTNESGLKLTTAFYYTPSGRSIQAEGIVPDIVVEQKKIAASDEDSSAGLVREKDLTGHLENKKAVSTEDQQEQAAKNAIKEDYQLNEALNLLKGLTVLSKK